MRAGYWTQGVAGNQQTRPQQDRTDRTIAWVNLTETAIKFLYSCQFA